MHLAPLVRKYELALKSGKNHPGNTEFYYYRLVLDYHDQKTSQLDRFCTPVDKKAVCFVLCLLNRSVSVF